MSLFIPRLLTADLADALLGGGDGMKGAPLPPERLRSVQVAYTDFEGKEKTDGLLITADAAAPSLASLFAELLQARFPLHSVRPVHEFGGDDEASMEANNSSCFNFRTVAGSGTLSVHAYGLAVDVNPEQNPYVRLGDETTHAAEIYPKRGKAYLNRANPRPGMVENIAPLFARHGFTVWGGAWNTPLDWHHFQTPRLTAELIALLPAPEAAELFALSTAAPRFFACPAPAEALSLKTLAGQDPRAALKEAERLSLRLTPSYPES